MASFSPVLVLAVTIWSVYFLTALNLKNLLIPNFDKDVFRYFCLTKDPHTLGVQRGNGVHNDGKRIDFSPIPAV